MALAGSLWVEGTGLHWLDSGVAEKEFDGDLVGASMGTQGSLWVEGNHMHYIDQNGDERRVLGDDTGNDPAAVVGSLWIEGENLHYVDASGDERMVQAVAEEDLFPDSDISSSGFSDNVVGDGDGALWDEIDEDPPDGDTTAIDGTTRTLSDSGIDTFEVGLEAATEPHSEDQTHTIWVRIKRIEGNSDDGIVQVSAFRLYQGTSLIDEHTINTVNAGETYEYRSHNMTVDGSGVGGAISDWSDLRIEIDVYTESVEYAGPSFSQTKARVTQAYLAITN